MPSLGLIAMIGTVLLGASPDAHASEAVPESIRALAIDVPMRSGKVAFRVPEAARNQELFLILSALATDGTFTARCSMSSPAASLAEHLPELSTLGPMAVIDENLGPEARSGAGSTDPLPVVDRPTAPARPVLRRAFSVLARPGDPGSPSNYDLVDARLRAVGERIQVFVDDDDVAVVSDEVLRQMVSAFDRVIEPGLAARLGTATDVDRDGRFTVLLSRRVGLPFAGRSHLDGYFRATDLDEELPRPFSNRADMIYLNADLQPGPYLETVLAHEYAHAVLESRRREAHGGQVAEESWLDEALAHLCEDIVGQSSKNLDYRVSAFLSEPNRYQVIVDDEHRPGRFRCHGNRGASYLFLRWCAATFDQNLALTLCTQSEVGPANLERAIGLPFEELYRRWTIAMTLESIETETRRPGYLDLIGSPGDWPLGGVRFETIGPDEAGRSFTIEGTSSAYLRLAPDSASSGPLQVVIECDPAALPQVTAVLVPSKLPRAELEVTLLESGLDSSTVVARIEERAGQETQLVRLSWEPLVPPADLPRSALGFRSLDTDALQSVFPDNTTLGPGQVLHSVPFRISNEELRSAPLVFRLTTQAADGGRSVSWAELLPSPPVLAIPARVSALDRSQSTTSSMRSGPTP